MKKVLRITKFTLKDKKYKFSGLKLSLFFCKNNQRDLDKNKLRTFEPRVGENFKNIELQRKRSGSYKKRCVGKYGEFTVIC